MRQDRKLGKILRIWEKKRNLIGTSYQPRIKNSSVIKSGQTLVPLISTLTAGAVGLVYNGEFQAARAT